MIATLTKIAEGPREDGRVRYQCDQCGRLAPWMLPAESATGKTLWKHNCSNPNKSSAEAASTPCVQGSLSDAFGLLLNAKRKTKSEDLRELIEAQLGIFDEMRKLAATEAEENRG
jgi:hypothetical protein